MVIVQDLEVDDRVPRGTPRTAEALVLGDGISGGVGGIGGIRRISVLGLAAVVARRVRILALASVILALAPAPALADDAPLVVVAEEFAAATAASAASATAPTTPTAIPASATTAASAEATHGAPVLAAQADGVVAGGDVGQEDGLPLAWGQAGELRVVHPEAHPPRRAGRGAAGRREDNMDRVSKDLERGGVGDPPTLDLAGEGEEHGEAKDTHDPPNPELKLIP